MDSPKRLWCALTTVVATSILAPALCAAGLREAKTADEDGSRRDRLFRLDHQEENLLSNGDFRHGLERWTFQAWKDRTAKADRDAGLFGHASVRVRQPNPTDSALTQTVAVTPGRRYRLSGWIRTENVVKPAIANQRSGAEGASLTIMGDYRKSASVTGTHDWMRVSLDFTPKPGERSVRIGLRLGHYGKLVTGTAWFADVSLVELPGIRLGGQ